MRAAEKERSSVRFIKSILLLWMGGDVLQRKFPQHRHHRLSRIRPIEVASGAGYWRKLSRRPLDAGHGIGTRCILHSKVELRLTLPVVHGCRWPIPPNCSSDYFKGTRCFSSVNQLRTTLISCAAG